MIPHTGETIWDADAPSAKRSSSVGSNGDTPTVSPPSSPDSLLPAEQVMLRLAQVMEEQNQALWALVEQTAALIAVVLETNEDAEEPNVYLDGTPIGGRKEAL